MTGPAPGSARLAVVAGAMLWGTTGTAQALADTGADPAAVGAVRLLVGAIGLVAVSRRTSTAGRRPPPHLARRWPVVTVVGAGLAQAVYGPAFFGGVDRAGVAVGTVVGIGTAPVVGGLLGWGWRQERPDTRWSVATAVALVGMAVLASGAGGDDVDLVGLALAMTAGGAYAVFVACTRALADHHPPMAVMAVTFTVAALALLPVAIAGGRPLLSWRGAALVAHLGLVTVVAAYVLFARGLAQLDVATIATLTLAEPATAAVLGVVVLGEAVSAAAVAGVALIAVAVVALVVPAPAEWRRSARAG